jgi:hypothetical protein
MSFTLKAVNPVRGPGVYRGTKVLRLANLHEWFPRRCSIGFREVAGSNPAVPTVEREALIA